MVFFFKDSYNWKKYIRKFFIHLRPIHFNKASPLRPTPQKYIYSVLNMNIIDFSLFETLTLIHFLKYVSRNVISPAVKNLGVTTGRQQKSMR